MWSLSPKRRTLALWLILFLAIVASSIRGYEQVGQRMDDGALLLYPELILKGWLPYRDFETFYGPANAYLLAGVYAIFPANQITLDLSWRAHSWLTSIALAYLDRRLPERPRQPLPLPGCYL